MAQDALARGEIVQLHLQEIIPQRSICLYRNFSNAQYVLNRAVADGYEGNIVYKDPYYAVQIGEYNTLDEAVRLENELKKKGYDTLVIKE